MTTEQERLLAAALSDYLDRKAEGEPIDANRFVAEFGARHPGLADELRSQIAAMDSIDAAASSTTTGGDAVRQDVTGAEPAPATLSGYEILSEIGSGGMGRVLLGYDSGLRRKVAIKMLGSRWLEHARLRARFMEEARALARVSHPNVVRVYSLGQDQEPPHFVMEYVEGAPVTTAARPLSIEQKAELFRKVALAVAHLHERSIIHRDIKPGNILTGADLEPKLLDFGLARQLDEAMQLTQEGEVLGTPLYFSPEQARGEALDPRSDVFSMGVLLYELLTGTLPFRAAGLREQAAAICREDPVLPRRHDAAIPGDLQNICLKALEKDPADRYPSAVEFARDLERFLEGEPVAAAPRSYSRLISGQIEQHLRDIDSWRSDKIVNLPEYDALRKAYDHLFEREDAWIMEFRRLTLSNVVLYLGAWVLTVGALLLVLFRYTLLTGAPAVTLAACAAVLACWTGVRMFRRDELRTSIAYLLAFCLLAPCTLLVTMQALGWFTAFSQGRRELEFIPRFESLQPITNAQLWWAVALALPVYAWLRRFTRASVFSLVFAAFSAVLALVTLLRMGLLEWLDKDPGRVYLNLLPVATLFFAVAFWLERRRSPADSRYFYTYAVIFTIVALTGVASFHEPYAQWLGRAAPWTHGKIEYLFLINAAVYAALQDAGDRFAMPQMRSVAKAFRFLIPGHVMGSLLSLGAAATARFQAKTGSLLEARLFEVLLPAAALAFVLLAAPRQMKNFLASGLIFLAIGLVRLQQNLLEGSSWWPITLIAAGLILLYLAANPSTLKIRPRK